MELNIHKMGIMGQELYLLTEQEGSKSVHQFSIDPEGFKSKKISEAKVKQSLDEAVLDMEVFQEELYYIPASTPQQLFTISNEEGSGKKDFEMDFPCNSLTLNDKKLIIYQPGESSLLCWCSNRGIIVIHPLSA